MVFLLYPLKDSIPNSSAVLSYKIIIKQFSYRSWNLVKRLFKHS